MSINDYQEALKKGMKAYKKALHKGMDPYLPSLDESIDSEKKSTIYLGLMQVPTEYVVGTRTAARANSFADNFMPIMEMGSEFSRKWISLCQSHLEEGIRDPLKVVEYMNRYYVEEGNKRFSVLKYFGSVTIAAEVTRIMPDAAETPEEEQRIQMYKELLDFYKLSGINNIEFSKPGTTVKLQKIMGKAADEGWSDEDRSLFKSSYYYFRRVYDEIGGGELTSTPGDAYVAYCELYGVENLKNQSLAVIKKNLSGMWEEVKLQEKENPVKVILEPKEEKKPGVLSQIIPDVINPAKIIPAIAPAPKKKVAFIHDKDADTSGWTYGHELGRLYVEQVMGDRIETYAYNNAMDEDPEKVLEQAIEDGNDIIFTTSPRLLPASYAAAVAHQHHLILNCSVNSEHRYVRSYYSRMYEAKFIIGAIAGSLTKSDRLGYICDYPIYGQIAGINAFALGAQMVNPDVKVYLEWSSIGSEEAAVKRLTDQGIHLISAQDMDHYRWGLAKSSFGLMRIEDDKREMLAMPTWEWGIYYEKLIQAALDKTLSSDYSESSRALNYYLGMKTGVIDVYVSDRLPESVQKLAQFIKTAVSSNVCPVFSGPVRKQTGETLNEKENPDITETLTVEQIINMNELVDNVIGSIPVYEELTPIAKATVEVVGVEGTRAE